MPSRLLLTMLLAAGCGGPTDLEGEAPETIVPPPTAAEVEPPAGAPERIVGDDGALLESEESVEGLVLPRGLEVVADEESRHVFRTHSSIDLLVAYLGPRLETAEVERTDRGAVRYLRARPTGAHGGPRMDVTVAPTSGPFATRLELGIEPEEALGEPSEEETRRRLEALAREGE